jgi:hypothetical protein
LLAPDVAVRSLAAGQPAMKFSTTRHGRSEAEQYFTDLAEQWEMIEFHTEAFIAEGDRVVMVGRCEWRFRATGKTVESPIAHIWRFRGQKRCQEPLSSWGLGTFARTEAELVPDTFVSFQGCSGPCPD